MARMGCLFLFIVIVAGIVGYDQYRITQMQNEVRAISGKVHITKPKKSGGAKDLVTMLAEAQRHAKNAKALIKKNKTLQAQAELDKALANLESANGVSQDIVGDVADVLGNARDKTIKVFKKAWKDVSEEAETPKVDAKK